MSSNGPIIRFATREDIPTILSLIRELAAYENASDSVEATEQSLASTLELFDPQTNSFSPGYARTLLISPPSPPSSLPILSESNPPPPVGDAPVVGMALYFPTYSTWRSAPGIYLEDLYIQSAHRGKGYGTALLRRLAKECVQLGGKRLEWSCLDWNEKSLSFYKSEAIGARELGEWVGLRVDGEKLGMLAGMGEGGE